MKKVRKNRRKCFRIRYIVMLLILIYGGTIFVNQQRMIKELEEEKASKVKEIEQLKNRNMELERFIMYASTEEYLERLARDELGMVKPYEIIFIDKNKNKFIKGLKD